MLEEILNSCHNIGLVFLYREVVSVCRLQVGQLPTQLQLIFVNGEQAFINASTTSALSQIICVFLNSVSLGLLFLSFLIHNDVQILLPQLELIFNLRESTNLASDPRMGSNLFNGWSF